MKLNQLEQAGEILGCDHSDSIALQIQRCEAGRRKTGRYTAQQVIVEIELFQLFHAAQRVLLDVGDVVVVQHQQPHLEQVFEIPALQTPQTVPCGKAIQLICWLVKSAGVKISPPPP